MDKTLSRLHQGLQAESLACRHLETKGFRFVESNFRWRRGELDLVMHAADGTLVFVEVRSAKEASPWLRQTIGPAKRRHLVRTAHEYRFRRRVPSACPWRFDVVWIEGDRVEHWTNVLLGFS